MEISSGVTLNKTVQWKLINNNLNTLLELTCDLELSLYQNKNFYRPVVK